MKDLAGIYSVSAAITDFILSRPPFDKATILVAGRNFGCGSSREHAVWALADFGVRCVIAPSFGEIFYGNCFRNGVLPIVLPNDEHRDVTAAAATGLPLTVDLEAQTIRLPDGSTIAFGIDAHRRRALLLGLDQIGAILADDAAEIACIREPSEDAGTHGYTSTGSKLSTFNAFG